MCSFYTEQLQPTSTFDRSVRRLHLGTTTESSKVTSIVFTCNRTTSPSCAMHEDDQSENSDPNIVHEVHSDILSFTANSNNLLTETSDPCILPNVSAVPFENSESLDSDVASFEQDCNAEPESAEATTATLESTLYQNTIITDIQHLLAFTLAHKLTKEASADLLALIAMLLPKPHFLPSSVFTFYKLLNLKKAATFGDH